MKVLIVTGTPGTGKTTLAKTIASKLHLNYIDINKIVKKYNLSESYDRKRRTKIIDIKRLNRALIKEISAIKKYTITKKINKKNFNIILSTRI